jgi:hypothetical protein
VGFPASDASILLLHDGELEDVRGLLSKLGLPCLERRGAARPEDRERPWDLILANPRRMLDLERSGLRAPTRIAILDRDSKTLRAALKRAAIDYSVLRPVHPEAMRLLLLHALYRGPERRRKRRVSVGGAVRFRAGWRRYDGVLADLSPSGCRVLTAENLPVGRSLRVELPRELCGGRPLRLRGSVVRRIPAEGETSPSVGVRFDDLGVRVAARLAEVIRRFQSGPAVFDGAPRLSEPVGASERRRSPRGEMKRHVIGLKGDDAPVLMGRDVSVGGMRVDSHPSLSLHDELQLAIHVRAREDPLVVRARVTRDDGPRGLFLEFFDLPDSSRSYLEKMVDFLPILAVRDGGDSAGIVMSEILEQH